MKSHVSMGHEVCPICYEHHSEVILLDKRLRNTLERKTVTGISLCPKHKAMQAEYVALVAVSNHGASRSLKPTDATPTGVYAHVRRSVAAQMFNITIAGDMPMVYVDPEVIEMLKAQAEAAA